MTQYQPGIWGGDLVNKSQLVQALAEKEGLTTKAAANIVNTVFRSITETLIAGDRVEIRSFGSFKVKHYDGYNGHNPRTGERIEVKPKKLPFFKVGKALKDRVGGEALTPEPHKVKPQEPAKQ